MRWEQSAHRPILPLLREQMIVTGILALYVLLAVGCSREANEVSKPLDLQRNGERILIPDGSPLRRRIQLGTAVAETTGRKLSVPAVIEADPERFARVYPPLSGHLLKLSVQLGDSVQEGQLVATMQSGDFSSAQGDFLKAKSAQTLAAKARTRASDLYAAKVIAEKDLEQAQSDLEMAQSDLATAEQRLRALGFDPAKGTIGAELRIYSPVTGKVVDVSSAHQEFHNDTTAALLTIADLSTVWMTANVAEKDLRGLQAGQEITASVEAYPDEVFRGKILFVGDLIDPDTRTDKVRIAFANPDERLKPGMFANVQILGLLASHVTIPVSAIVQSGGSAFVYVQTASWEFQPRKVVVGEQTGDRVVVLDGLAAGETVVTKEGVLLQ